LSLFSETLFQRCFVHSEISNAEAKKTVECRKCKKYQTLQCCSHQQIKTRLASICTVVSMLPIFKQQKLENIKSHHWLHH